MRYSWAVALIIVASSSFVNAAISFQDQVQIAVLKGDDDVIKSDQLNDHLHTDRRSPIRLIEINEDQTADGLSHDFEVVLKDAKPACVVFWVDQESPTEAHVKFYRVNLSGKLEAAFVQIGRFDAEHKPIRGSGVITDLKLTKEVRAAFRHELDFWLKGMYRKPAAGSVANVTPTR